MNFLKIFKYNYYVGNIIFIASFHYIKHFYEILILQFQIRITIYLLKVKIIIHDLYIICFN